MRCLVLTLLFASPVVTRADDPGRAQVILNRALQAMGGDTQSAHRLAATWKARVTLHGLGDPLVYSGEWSVLPPEKVRIYMTGSFHGRPFERLLIINGDQGWVKQDGAVQNLDHDRLAEEKERIHAAWVATLLPLRSADFDLVPLGNDPAASTKTGLRVSHAGHRDVLLYFDESGRLVESKTRCSDPSRGAQETETVRYADYRLIEGMQVPTRISIRRNGKLLAESKLTEYRRHSRLKAALFHAPR